uniref:Uncharacterized protein n=1 Tax=Monodelphis domestica TaxID=13616 RepID=A0A5F8H3B8_MONDO
MDAPPWGLVFQSLKAAVHYTVGSLCQEAADAKGVKFSKPTIAAISEEQLPGERRCLPSSPCPPTPSPGIPRRLPSSAGLLQGDGSCPPDPHSPGLDMGAPRRHRCPASKHWTLRAPGASP